MMKSLAFQLSISSGRDILDILALSGAIFSLLWPGLKLKSRQLGFVCSYLALMAFFSISGIALVSHLMVLILPGIFGYYFAKLPRSDGPATKYLAATRHQENQSWSNIIARTVAIATSKHPKRPLKLIITPKDWETTSDIAPELLLGLPCTGPEVLLSLIESKECDPNRFLVLSNDKNVVGINGVVGSPDSPLDTTQQYSLLTQTMPSIIIWYNPDKIELFLAENGKLHSRLRWYQLGELLEKLMPLGMEPKTKSVSGEISQ